MLTANVRKNYTANGDPEAERILSQVVSELGNDLTAAGLSVYLGGSYGRGDGGVRQDKENGILYNDLDFFVFSRKRLPDGENRLKELAEKYEKELRVDVDFSRIMSVNDIKNNARRLMMQELKRGYRLVCGEDLLAAYLPEIPAEQLPYSEACRLLLNRGMGLLLAGEMIRNHVDDPDFILRNINKAILGAGDAVLIAEKHYKWNISERLAAVKALELPDEFKNFYTQAVEFKKSPNREIVQDLSKMWSDVRDMFRRCIEETCGQDLAALPFHCENSGEISLKHLIKYCIKLRKIPVTNWQWYMLPTVAALIPDLDQALEDMPGASIRNSKLYRHWLIFN